MADKKDAADEVATVKMDMPRARIVGRRAYGPGQGVEVPADVAAKLGAEEKKAAKNKKKGAK